MNDVSAEKILSEVFTWKKNRALYPGWLIAPHQIRERLWMYARFWVDEIIRVVPALPLEERLIVLGELNWRLETALIPLWSNLASAVSDCLEGINPFGAELSLDQAQLLFSKENLDRKRPGWDEIRRVWMELAFGILRFHREERRRSDFDRWADRLGGLTASSGELKARLLYERCLDALAEMDDMSVRNLLKQWPDCTTDIAWDMRRAGVLAEIGILKESLTLTEPKLSKLREGLRHAASPIPSLSREGWMMQLLRGLLSGMSILENSAWPADEDGRWEQLTKDYCNPRIEIEFFESRLDGPAPMPVAPKSRTPSFQPGAYTQSFSVDGTWIDKILPAYQYMRLVEDAPYPPRCGSVTLSEKTLKRIGEWFMIHDPVRTQSLVCRLLDEKLAEVYFSRHRVASLALESAEHFVRIAERAIDQALPDSRARSDGERSALADRTHDRLLVGIGLLSRLVIRAAPETCSTILNRAMALFSSPAVQYSPSLPKPLNELFRSVILCISATELNERLIDLIALPIPGSSSFPVTFPEGWPEFFHDLIDRLPKTGRRSDSAGWTVAIRKLMDAAGDPNERVRGRAILRLFVLYRHGYLRPGEADELAQNYWGQEGKPTTIPAVLGLSNRVCLAMPEPEAGIAVRIFREHVLGLKLQPLGGGVQDGNSPLCDWLNVTKIRRREEDERAVYVDWSEEDVGMMFEAIREWWESSGRAQSQRLSSTTFPESLTVGGLRNRIHDVLNVLACIIIPRISPTSALAAQVLSLVSNIQQQGLPTEAVLPALLMIKDDPEITSRLRQGLASPDEHIYISSLRGLLYWLDNQPTNEILKDKPNLPPIPRDLVHELGVIVAVRRQPGLAQALSAVVAILRRCPQAVDDHFKDSLRVGLGYLFSEAAYRPFETVGDRIGYDEVPNVRRWAAEVAALLQYCMNESSPVVQRWVDSAIGDPLPEVRRAVESSSEFSARNVTESGSN
jgi:hypothetical protein